MEVALSDAMVIPALVVPAPAKLNLFLHVTGRQPASNGGYHLLESLMVLVDLADTLRLTRCDDGRIVREHPVEGVDESADLALRAATRLKAATGSRWGVSIALHKRIPIGAGLGGGSSDAASVLLGLNRLWSLGLSRQVLMQIGVELGADVPFFVFGRNAHATGIGEVLRAVTIPRLHVLIAAPDRGVSTASIFSAPDLERATPPTGADTFAGGCGRNDLQPIAVAREPAISAALAMLDALEQKGPAGWCLPDSGEAARMTGSGSAVFRIVGSSRPGVESPESRAPHGFRLFRTRLLAAHPLRDFAAK